MKAFVVVRIENSKQPGAFVAGVGIYSQPWSELTLRHKPGVAYANVLEAEGRVWPEARDKALQKLRLLSGTMWMAEWIEAGKEGAAG